MAIIDSTGLHHIRLTVTDIARSRAFYETVFGFPVAAESPGDPADPAVRADPSQLYGGVLFHAGGALLGLRPVADPSDRFDADRVGLDHLSFSVASSAELSVIATKLAEAGIEHGEVIELTGFGIAILSLSDPDGVHLELTAPL